MILRYLLCALLACALAGCESPYKKSDVTEKKARKDFSKDPSFQSFLGRLQIAVTKRDQQMLTALMAPGFGYRWDDGPPGETAFMYWEQHKLWDELTATLKKRFVPHEDFMVAPPEVADDPAYTGYRAGARVVGGSWRFAYFVPTEPAQ
jgi:hypothetical protein